MKTHGHNILGRLFKKEGVRGLLAAGLFAALPLLGAPARAADLYPGNGAVMSGVSGGLILILSYSLPDGCGTAKHVDKLGTAGYTTIQAAVNAVANPLTEDA
ncbi:MAG: hypothetical protein COT18_03130, partial [Elusimicrobia bacterium CG08_land_8_20_14_0_20_59_10]